MWKKLLSENNKKNHRKVKSSQPTCLRLLGSAMNGNKNTNKKNDENQIKNANPNPNGEERKESNRRFLFLYKKLSTLLFQLYKTLPLEVGSLKHPVPFFFMGHCTVAYWKRTCKNYIKQSAWSENFSL